VPRARSSPAAPPPEHELLLRVAAGEQEQALSAWREWTERHRLDAVDEGAQRLLPLVYRRLVALGVDDPHLGRLKGLYRRAWYRNQILFRHAASALAELQGAGLETMLLKGASLSLLYYRDDGVRPMDDVDVLVRADSPELALEALTRSGWTRATATPLDALVAVRHAEELAGPGAARLDLHWNALWQPGDDGRLWERSVETAIAGQPARALSPAHELLVACVHGTGSSEAPSIRWAADALTILAAAAGGVAWGDLVAHARDRRLTLAVADALAYLRGELGAPVPEAVLGQLRSTATRRHERLGQRALAATPGPLTTVFVVWDRYRRLREVANPLPRPRGFLGYAAQTWGFEQRRGLLAHAVRRLASRSVSRLTARRLRARS
jgi:hypothetical protein